MSIRLSEKHGVNPSLDLCFLCNEPKGVALLGRLPGDAEAPRQAVFDEEPCDKCLEWMKQGIILISVDESQSPPEKVRDCTCLRCKHRFTWVVKYGPTPNISGERTIRCPKCNSHVSAEPIHERACQNPYRTGGWCVIKEEAVRRMGITPPELLEDICKKRVAFLPDEVWSMLGLPRGS